MNMKAFEGCPGSQILDFKEKDDKVTEETIGTVESQLRQWPIQLHLISPTAPYYQESDVLLAADCVAYALGDFHRQFLKEKSIAIACPKLDEGQQIYLDKIKSWFEDARINTLTVMIMQVPCCTGLLQLAQQAAQASQRKVPLKCLVVGLKGEILQEEWV
jgi:hypothetical protein